MRGYVDPDLDETSLDLDAPRDADDRCPTRAADPVRRDPPRSTSGRATAASSTRARRSSAAGASRSVHCSRARTRATAWPATSTPTPRTHRVTPGPVRSRSRAGRYLELFVPIRGMRRRQSDRRLRRLPGCRPHRGAHRGDPAGCVHRRPHRSEPADAAHLLSFGGASRVLARQNRQLQEQADDRATAARRPAAERGALPLAGTERLGRRDRPRRRRSRSGTRARPSSGSSGDRTQRRIGRPATTDVHPDDRATVERRLAEVASASGSEATVEFRARHADGSWRTLEAIAKNLLDDPAVGGVVVNYRDITERKALEEQLRHQAFHDVLTGLANRSLFRDRLGHALARAAAGAEPDRGPLPRYRRLQGGQRSARARRGRSTARRRRPAPAVGDPRR